MKNITSTALLSLAVGSALLSTPIALADNGPGLGDNRPQPPLQSECPIEPYGDIGAFYRAHGGAGGDFGCPTSEEYDLLGGRAQNYIWGQIVWKQSGDHVITMGLYQEKDLDAIHFEWWDSADRDFYLVRYRQDKNNVVQTGEIEGNNTIISPVYWPDSTFRFNLNGCEKEHFLGVRSGSHCYGWATEVLLVTHPKTPTPPPPPPPSFCEKYSYLPECRGIIIIQPTPVPLPWKPQQPPYWP